MKKFTHLLLLIISYLHINAQQTPAEIKSILENIERVNRSSDDYYDSTYQILNHQINIQTGKEQAIWHSCMAQFLNSYYQENSWEILERTSVSGEKNPDFKTWDVKTLVAEIVFHYQKSIEQKELLQIADIKDYALIMDSMISVPYRPTLYDFLAFRALDFYATTIRNMPLPLTPFVISNTSLFSDNEEFINQKITSPDSLSFQFLSLKLMQEVTRFHLSDENPLPLIDITLRRLSYIHDQSNYADNKKLYLSALEKMEVQYRQNPGYEDVAYSLGNFFEERATLYNKEFYPEYQFDYNTAISWFKKAIESSPQSLAAKNSIEKIKHITAKEVTFTLQTLAIPDQKNMITYSYRNCDSLFVRIIPITEKEEKELDISRWGHENLWQKIINLNYSHSFSFKALDLQDHRKTIGDGILPALATGRYCVIVSSSSFKSPMEVYSIEFIELHQTMITYRKNGNDYEFFVLERATGKPLKNTKLEVDVWTYSGNKSLYKEIQTTDHAGKATFTIKNYNSSVYLKVTAYNGKQAYHYGEIISHYPYNKSDRDNLKLFLYTDRAIYRPGQTVYYKGIIINKKTTGEHEVVVGKKGDIELRDVNWQTIHTNSYTTNEYGSFSGSFTIPEGTLTGNFTIRTAEGSSNLLVEEYKRPQFEVTIDQPEGSYALNEMVSLKGQARAYAGFAIDGAEVSYRITRQAHFPWRRWWMPPSLNTAQQEIIQGRTVTDQNGEFFIDFSALPDQTSPTMMPVYTFNVMVSVTDINGETHSANTMIMIGTVSLEINLSIPDEVCIDNKKSLSFPLSTTNLIGKPLPSTLNVKITALESPIHYLHDRVTEMPTVSLFDQEELKKAFPNYDLNNENIKDSWKERETIYKGTLQTPTDTCLTITNPSKLKSGYYKIVIDSKDQYGKEVLLEKIVYLYKEKESKCWAYEPAWLNTNVQSAQQGDQIIINIGSYMQDADMLFEVISNDKLLSSEWIHVNKSCHTIIFPVTNSHKGQLVFNLWTTKDNRIYSKSATVNIPFKEMEIHFEWITFRDKMLPGENESWKLKIKGSQGERLAGELLCSMYDASLDAFSSNSYYWPLFTPEKKLMNYRFSSIDPYSQTYFPSSPNYPYQENRNYYKLKWDIYYNNWRQYYKNADRTPITSYDRTDSEENLLYAEGTVLLEDFSDAVAGGASLSQPELQLRKNFNETAFFYPQMESDEDGNLLISFTMPDALTEWKFQTIAHTKELKTGSLEAFVQTQKPLMVVPNAPRFFREGDTLIFSAKVVNMSDESLKGKVTLTLLDALTNTPLSILIGENERSFSVSKGNSENVSFKIAIPMDIHAITYRIIAQTSQENFSDGEEKSIPVLSNRMLVTESMPLAINGQQKKTFVFDKMKENNSNTLNNFRYSIEFTSNPAWYAILSLPYLIEYPYDCNEQIFSRVYANSIASHIVNSSPKIKEIFDSWQNMTPNTFCSELDKNEELKNIVLEETPWVMQAQSESERKQQVGILFNLQRMAKENNTAINKLQKGQNSDGGWAWFSGGKSSEHITQHIISGFGHLETMNIDISLNRKSLQKAILFLDSKKGEEYEKLKSSKNVKLNENHLNPLIVHYLYARTYHLKKIAISKTEQEMYTYYIGQAKKYWEKQNIYTQAMIALILYRSGDPVTAVNIIKSLKNQAQYSDEMGMFWKKEGSSWLWYEAPIERQAILIEAFSLITKDEESVEKMQQWLLKQKQSQDWGNTRSTAEACYALLLRGNDLLQTESGVKISVGNTVIDVDHHSDSEAGTGYFKASWQGGEIIKEMGSITVDKPTKGIAWGAAYWQYFEDLDKITAAETPLTITKELYKVILNDRGEILVPYNDNLKVGDKVRVRIKIHSDRDMEYIHLKDMRASAFEPVNVLSQYKRQGSLWYYESTRDAATNFFIEYLPKGTYIFEYTLIASQSGVFSNGIGSIQCMYAPEFSAHSDGIKIEISGF